MGFYVANEHQAVTEPRLRRQARQGTPLKKSRLEFFSSTCFRARFSMPKTLDTHRKKRSTPTNIASGVRYYGYRYYSPSLGRFTSQDPIFDPGNSVRLDFRKLLMAILPEIDTIIVQSEDTLVLAKMYHTRIVVQSIVNNEPDFWLGLGGNGQSLNMYHLCRNNALNRIDLIGLKELDECQKKNVKDQIDRLNKAGKTEDAKQLQKALDQGKIETPEGLLKWWMDYKGAQGAAMGDTIYIWEGLFLAVGMEGMPTGFYGNKLLNTLVHENYHINHPSIFEGKAAKEAGDKSERCVRDKECGKK